MPSSSALLAPKGERVHIGLFGRRNVGKSSLLNAFVGQEVSIVSPTPGTTTDLVEKAVELSPFGATLLLDTAGLDDEGALGEARVGRTLAALDRVDLALVVTDGAWGDPEERLLAALATRKIPALAVFNKADRAAPSEAVRADLDMAARTASPEALWADLARRGLPSVRVSAATGEGLGALREALAALAPEALLEAPQLLGDLVGPGEVALLVTPIDSEAPKGRLILPQVQSIRDLLDHRAIAVVCLPAELSTALGRLAAPPRLVITDSQAFKEVDAALPPEIPLTSFSILFARLKGDLETQARGAAAIDTLVPGDRVLVAEGCSHHPGNEDIGRQKIPRLLEKKVGGPLRFEFSQGRDFPADLGAFKLVVQCGACTFNRRQVQARLARCREAGVPVTNYGLAIAKCLGILDRALGPFR